MVRSFWHGGNYIYSLGNKTMMKIKALVAYSHDGDRRVINFNANGVSIISGESKSGKSAIGDSRWGFENKGFLVWLSVTIRNRRNVRRKKNAHSDRIYNKLLLL